MTDADDISDTPTSSEIEISPPKNDINDTRFVTFNVCGIKNVLNYMPWCQNKTFEYMFKSLRADVVCFQETKIQYQDLAEYMALVTGYDAYFTFPTRKKGYSGVVIYVSKEIRVLKAEEGITGWLESPDVKGGTYRDLDAEDCIGGYPQNIDKANGEEIDAEGRSVVLDLGTVVVIGLYCPANSMGERDDYRAAFFECLDSRVRNLVSIGREVIIMGDLNIARSIMDSADARQELYKEGALKLSQDGEEFIRSNVDLLEQWKASTPTRKMLNGWVSGLEIVDCCRKFHPTRLGMYTCWNVKIGARAGNFGSRIDYVLATEGLECTHADILPKLLGSDHCPVYADIQLHHNDVASEAEKPPRLCAKYFSRFRNRRTIHSLFSSSNSSTKEPVQRPSASKGAAVATAKVNKARKANTPPSSKQKKLASFWGGQQQKQVQPSTFNDNSTPTQECETPDELVFEKEESSSEKLQDTVEGWKQIFTPPPPPLCTSHSEPCKLMTTKKKGINRGRSFWVCSR